MTDDNSDILCIVVAAGSGSRFGSDLPKQFLPLEGRPVLMHAIDALRRALPGAHCRVVLSRDMADYWMSLCRAHGFDSPRVVTGGETRWHSVHNALSAIDAATRYVLVHDGARPLPSPEMIRHVAEALRSGRAAAIPAIAPVDSLRLLNADGHSTALDRSRVRAVQTPQGFEVSTLLQAYRQPWRSEFTDDASVVEAAGVTDIVLTEGSPTNLKITRPLDLEVASLYMRHHSRQ